MTRSTPLAIAIAPGDGRSIAGQVVDAVRLKISTGELQEGAQLPSVRSLAQQLTINPNTVSKAYAELVAQGWLISRAGLGLYVSERRNQLSSSEQDRRLDVAIDRFVHDVVAIRCAPEVAADRVTAALSSLVRRRSA